MHAIRTLLSYSLVIVIVAAVVLAYYYRDQVMPEVDALYGEVESWVEKQTGSSPPADSGKAAGQIPEQAPPAVVAGYEPPAQSATVTEESSVPAADAEQAEMPQEEASAPPPEAPAEAEPPETLVAAGPAPDEAQPDVAVPDTDRSMMAAESPPEPSPEAQPATEPPAVVASPEPAPEAGDEEGDLARQEQELLRQARQAYWQRNYEEAEAAYRKLLEISPDNPDLYGELGNLYYATGKWKLAGDAYYQASTRLLQSGQSTQVTYLLRVLKGLDPDLADKLEQEMQQAN